MNKKKPSPSRARSLNVQSYVDARLFGDSVRVFNETGMSHKGSYSHVIHTVLRTAWSEWEAEFFQTTEEALDFLSSQGFSIEQLKMEKQGKKLLKAMNKEALSGEREEVENSSPQQPSEERVEELSELFHKEEG